MSGTHGAGLYKTKNKCDIACIDLEDGGIRPGVVLCFCMCVCVCFLVVGICGKASKHNTCCIGIGIGIGVGPLKLGWGWRFCSHGKERDVSRIPGLISCYWEERKKVGAREYSCWAPGQVNVESSLPSVVWSGGCWAEFDAYFPLFSLFSSCFFLSLRLSPFPGGLLREFSFFAMCWTYT